jgi:cob(I)alamin adenosyltransferase
MAIYTRTGDQGETGTRDGARLAKDDLRIEAVGTIDEINAAIGLVRAEPLAEEVDQLLRRIQNELFLVGAELAASHASGAPGPGIATQHVEALERAIDRCDARLPPMSQFILPGGTRAGAALHVARAVCRRAERRLVAVARSDASAAGRSLIPYLNRLGDLLFVLARTVNFDAGRRDVPWEKDIHSSAQ